MADNKLPQPILITERTRGDKSKDTQSQEATKKAVPAGHKGAVLPLRRDVQPATDYTIEQGIYGLFNIKRKKDGPVPQALSGSYTAYKDASVAILRYKGD